MKHLIAYCGLDCSSCKAYIATGSEDGGMIERTAKEWSEMYHGNISAKDVWCEGCTAQASRHCAHWSECNIRVCAQARQVQNCGVCPDYGCDTIASFIALAPDVKSVLDRIRVARK
jgi:hypothetical protein